MDLVGMRKSKSVNKARDLCHLDNPANVSEYKADHAVDFEIHHVDLGALRSALRFPSCLRKVSHPTLTTQAQSGATEALDADASDPLAYAS